MVRPVKKRKSKGGLSLFKNPLFRNFLFLFLVLASAGAAYYLVQNRITFFQRAAYDPSTRTYIATFDGLPTSPLPITQRSQSEFDIQVHSRDRGSWGDTEIPHMEAQHGPGCEGPEITHTVDNYEKTVFNCRNHMMTSVNGAAGYAQIAITPSYVADWRDGELVVKWDMSTLTMSSRDWVTVSVTPWEDNLALIEGDPGETPDLSGAPKESIYVNVGQNPFALCVHDIRNHQQVNPVGWVDGNDCDHWDGISNYLTPSAATRSTFEVRISPDRVTASVLNPDGTILKRWHDYRPSNHGLSPIQFNEGVVQFVQHSYTPEKDNSGIPATWHWDNLSISDATPFTMIKADKRHIEQDGEVVTFNSPAPANSYLRFHALGNVDVSFNGGPYERAQEPPQDLEPSATFFTPVPEGTSTVAFKFSGRSWYDYEKQAKDFAIWSRTYAGSSNPQPTSTTSNPTTAPSAPTATPTNTPTPTPTNTPTPTPTPLPTATPTPTPLPVGSVPGLKGNYFSDTGLSTLILTRIDPNINFNWGYGSPDPSIATDNYSVRWTGILNVPKTDTYTFFTRSDDGVRLWIDGSLIVNNWSDHAYKENSGKKVLSQGKHTIQVEYYERGGASRISLLWRSPSMNKQVIKKQYLLSE